MKIGSLFSGIGGLDLGVEAATGATPAWFCEFEPACQKIIRSHWPDVPCFPDVREMDASVEPIDILVGGYPCQPFSVAGLRKGEDDPRHLWPQFARLIRLLRPGVVVAENVSGHLALGFDAVLRDLAEMGMDVRWGVVRASDVGAPHRRERLFIVATDPERGRVDTDGRVRGRDDRGGGKGGRTVVSAGAEVAFAADSLPARAGSPADADGRRCEQRHEGIGGVSIAREDGSQTPPDSHRGRRGQRDARERDVRSISLKGGARDGYESSTDACRVGEGGDAPGRSMDDEGGTAWGDYGPAIERWEHIIGRGSPRPTDDRGRLNPSFVEWMMGLPSGWTEGPSRTSRLKMLGNAVVPQQAAYALSLLMSD